MDFIRKMRTRFEEFESKGKALSQCDHYKEDVQRVRKRNRRNDDPDAAPERPQTPVDKFRTGTFLVIVDNIASELQKRLGAYSEIAAKFGFLRKLKDLPNEQVTKCAINLQTAYPADLEDGLSDELLQFSSFLNTAFAKKSLEETSSPTVPTSSSLAISESETFFESEESDNEDTGSVAVVTKHDDDVLLGVESMELRLYRLIVANNLETVFPNTVILFRIYLSLMISNCSGERSFSKLKLLKSDTRSRMGQKRLNSLALLNMEAKLLRKLSLSSLINDFAMKKSRKHNVYRASSD